MRRYQEMGLRIVKKCCLELKRDLTEENSTLEPARPVESREESPSLAVGIGHVNTKAHKGVAPPGPSRNRSPALVRIRASGELPARCLKATIKAPNIADRQSKRRRVVLK